jgi:hypothetical protein
MVPCSVGSPAERYAWPALLCHNFSFVTKPLVVNTVRYHLLQVEYESHSALSSRAVAQLTGPAVQQLQQICESSTYHSWSLKLSLHAKLYTCVLAHSSSGLPYVFRCR